MVVGIFIKNENSQKLESFTEAGEQGRGWGRGDADQRGANFPLEQKNKS